ncbi:MAG: FtsX-like permease family protein [Sulfurimonas sp.]|nr:FtsX-like permease family protein [Sulfurimonas sp.]
MLSKAYLHFLAVLLFNNRVKHTWVIFISSLLIALLASFLFVKSSLEEATKQSIESQPDFIVQKYRAGHIQDMQNAWIDAFARIDGVDAVKKRVYGHHYYEPLESHFMIVGLDFSDEKELQQMKEAFPDFNLRDFLSKNNMILGSGVKQHFDYYEYTDNYNFRPPDRSIKKVYFYGTLPKESQLFTNDMILMDIHLARTILGVKSENSTDASINIINETKFEDVKTALILSHFDMRIISKKDVFKHSENLFNYKAGVFLSLYIVCLITFALILFQRYTNILHSDAKEIAILRMSGWKISDVIYLKLSENFLVAIVSYLLGVILAYAYVFILNAPLIRDIFLGFQNLQNTVSFTPHGAFASLVLIFFLFVVPFMLVILIPVYKISITEPVEVLR